MTAPDGNATVADKRAEYDYTVRADGRRSRVTETIWYDDDADSVPDPHVAQTDWTYDDARRLVDGAAFQKSKNNPAGILRVEPFSR